MYIIIATLILSSGITTGSIDNIQFDNEKSCKSYIKKMGYTNSKHLKFKCKKEINHAL